MRNEIAIASLLVRLACHMCSSGLRHSVSEPMQSHRSVFWFLSRDSRQQSLRRSTSAPSSVISQPSGDICAKPDVASDGVSESDNVAAASCIEVPIWRPAPPVCERFRQQIVRREVGG